MRPWPFVPFVIVCFALVFHQRLACAEYRLAGTVGVDGFFHVGVIESPNRVRLFLGQGSDWKLEFLTVATGNLIPGARFALQVGTKTDPQILRILTIGKSGEITLISGARGSAEPPKVQVVKLKDHTELFPPGSDFAFTEQGSRQLMYAVNYSGKLLEIDLVTRDCTVLEGRGDVVVPGGCIGMFEGHSDEIYLIDRRGNFVSYARDPVRIWNGPQLIGTGFLAGSDLVVWQRPDGGREIYVGAVDARGELRFMRHESVGWRMEVVPGWVFPAGSSIAAFHTPVNIRLFGVNGRGALQFMQMVNTEWRDKLVVSGYRYGTTIYRQSQSYVALSIDAAGDLLTSTTSNDVWSTVLTPDDGSTQRGTVLKREFSQPAATMTYDARFWNRSGTPITLRMRDSRNPILMQNNLVPAGESVTLTLDQPGRRTLSSRLSQPAPADAEVKEIEIERTREVHSETPYVFEVLKTDTGISYQDHRSHKSPRLRQKDPSEISLGRFRPPEKIEFQSTGPLQIDVIESAAKQQMVVIE